MVVAPDTTAPVVTVGVYYKIGFRLEPQGRSGFAHLFEHMMFQGSANAPKMQHIKLINSSGGVLNGSTSYDVTNYYEAVPSNALERVLWLEADRMRALKVDDENLQQPARRREGRSSRQRHEPALRRISLAGHAAGRISQLGQRAQFLWRFR